MKKEMTLKTRFILTSYCSIVISIMLIGIASYCLLGSMSKKFVLQTSEEAVRQKNEDIQTKLDGIEVTLRDIIYNSELQQTLTDYRGGRSIFKEQCIQFAEIGEGNLDMKSIIEASVEGGAIYLPIEQDQCYGRDPFDCIRTSVKNICDMGIEKYL